jgi:hypothetical protein
MSWSTILCSLRTTTGTAATSLAGVAVPGSVEGAALVASFSTLVHAVAAADRLDLGRQDVAAFRELVEEVDELIPRDRPDPDHGREPHAAGDDDGREARMELAVQPSHDRRQGERQQHRQRHREDELFAEPQERDHRSGDRHPCGAAGDGFDPWHVKWSFAGTDAGRPLRPRRLEKY